MSSGGWIRKCSLGFAGLLALAAVLGVAFGTAGPGTSPGRDEDPSLAVHPSGAHKLLVPTEDRPALDRLAALDVVQRRIDYGSFQLLVVGDRAVPAMSERALSRAHLRDDFDFVAVNRWTLDTREGEPKDLPADRLDRPGVYDRQLY